MKYMGSKRSMLMNGLGELMEREAPRHARVVDLFCGGASVSWFAAVQCGKPVLAIDLQAYAVRLAAAVVERRPPLDGAAVATDWLKDATAAAARLPVWSEACALVFSGKRMTKSVVSRARTLCAKADHAGVVWTPYGGHYFSPEQALLFDSMLSALPEKEHERSVCLAATIIAASQCAAAPGHTAQPFQPTKSAAPFIRTAWERDPIEYARRAVVLLCGKHVQKPGHCRIADALDVALEVTESDLVFVDPPYSEVHYSRFYHVLETVAKGTCGPVTGVGRYPPVEERPFSSFSRRSQSRNGVEELLKRLAGKGCSVIFTFPSGSCSNGLSGDDVLEIAGTWFAVDAKVVSSRFSTLGGNGTDRSARQNSQEMILMLRPRRKSVFRSVK